MGKNNVWMIVGVMLTLLSSASIFLSSVDLFLCLANSLKVSSRMLAACGRERVEGRGGGGGKEMGEEMDEERGPGSRKERVGMKRKKWGQERKEGGKWKREKE